MLPGQQTKGKRERERERRTDIDIDIDIDKDKDIDIDIDMRERDTHATIHACMHTRACAQQTVSLCVGPGKIVMCLCSPTQCLGPFLYRCQVLGGLDFFLSNLCQSFTVQAQTSFGQPAEHVKKSRVKTARFTNFFDCGRVWTASRTGLSSCGRVFFAPLAHV